MKKDPQVQEAELVPATTPKQPLTARTQQPDAPGFDIEKIFTMAIEKGGGVETIERLMSVRRELNAERSKKMYDVSMAAFQSECPPVKKTKTVKTDSGQKAYSYAPLEEVIAAVKPLLAKHGFSFAFDTDVSSQAGWVIAKCNVTHDQGHVSQTTAKFPLGGRTKIMSDTQVYAAALTFATRRVFQNAFGIVCEGEDNDGGKNEPRKTSTSGKSATAATREWFLSQTQDIAESLFNYAVENAWLAPNEKLTDFPLAHVPTTQAELAELREDITKWLAR